MSDYIVILWHFWGWQSLPWGTLMDAATWICAGRASLFIYNVLWLSQASGKGVLVLNRADALLRITFWPAYKINLVHNRTSELQKCNSKIKNDLKSGFSYFIFILKNVKNISRNRDPGPHLRRSAKVQVVINYNK